MATALYAVILDAVDHRALARWWAEALQWEAGYADDGIAWAEQPGRSEQALGVVPVPEPKTVKGRVHLDLRGPDQAAEVERLLRLGATRADVGQPPDASWVVLADPEGNEFCVLAGPAPRPTVAVVAIDAVDPRRVADFWAAALGYERVDEEPDGVSLAPPGGAPGLPLDLLTVPDAKRVKNRLHLDLNPGPDGDQVAEVERLLALGATRADVGQAPDVSWVVLADPEGNEFCVLTPREP